MTYSTTDSDKNNDAGLEIRQADHYEAAAVTAAAADSMNSGEAFIRLLTVCGGSCAQALVLCDLVRFHALEGVQALRVLSASELVRLYPSPLWNARSAARAVIDLEHRKLIVLVSGVRNTAKQYRLNDSVFRAKCTDVSVAWLKGPKCDML